MEKQMIVFLIHSTILSPVKVCSRLSFCLKRRIKLIYHIYIQMRRLLRTKEVTLTEEWVKADDPARMHPHRISVGFHGGVRHYTKKIV